MAPSVPDDVLSSFFATPQLLATWLSLLLACLVPLAFRSQSSSFKRVGISWPLRFLPGPSSMTWNIDKYVSKGYNQVCALTEIFPFIY